MAWYDNILNAFRGRPQYDPLPTSKEAFGSSIFGQYGNTIYYRDSAVFACVRLLAGSAASLPLHAVDRRTGQIAEGASAGGRWNSEILRGTFGGQPFSTFMLQMMRDLLIGGNAFVLPKMTGSFVQSLELIRPAAITIIPDDDTGSSFNFEFRAFINGRRELRPSRTYNQDNLIHVRLLAIDDKGQYRFQGSPPVTSSLDTSDASIASYERVANFFRDGVNTRAQYRPESRLNPQQIKALRDALSESGNGDMIVLGNGDVVPLALDAMSPQEEALRVQVRTEVAMRYGVPPGLVGAGTGDQRDHSEDIYNFYRFGLRHYLDVIEDTLSARLLGPRFDLRFDVHKLWMNDPDWLKVYSDATSGVNPSSIVTVNEKRRIFGMPPIEGGDELIQVQASGADSEDSSEPATTDSV